jgi:hypothetical protein|nr:MAG TPA: Prohead core protein protease [Caudoviricetes sp.]
MDNITFLGSLLTEATNTSGKYPVKVIQPGWGSSGYYSNDVLAASASLFEGAQMFWNHPKSSDNYERPERDLRDLAGVLTNVRYEESNASGAGIYGDAIVFDAFRETLDEIAPYIGVSIRAGGKVHEGEAEDRGGLIVDEINLVQSVDFVTRAGAGGKVLAQFAEAARPIEILEEKEKENDMELEEAIKTIGERDETINGLNNQLTEAQSTIDALTQEVSRLSEVHMLAECSAIVAAELKESDLPEVTKERIQQESGKFMATKDEGDEESIKKVLDQEKVKESVQEAIKAEAEYISKLSGGINISGMGSNGHEDGGKLEEAVDMTDTFKAMGLTENEAKIAAKGR